MNKYQVIVYSSNSRYSHFIKVPNMNNVYAESYLAVEEAFSKYIFRLNIQIDEIYTRKVK